MSPIQFLVGTALIAASIILVSFVPHILPIAILTFLLGFALIVSAFPIASGSDDSGPKKLR